MSFRELKAGEPLARNWRAINELGRWVDEEARRADALRRRMRSEEQRGLLRAGTHPFQIYCADGLYNEVTTSESWRTVRVRGGRVFESEATGTDGATAPDGGELAATGDIVVPAATAQYWIWLEVSTAGTTAAVVRHAANPTVVHATHNPTPWATYPRPDAEHIPIGFVDTSTKADSLQVVIRQLLRTDVVQVGGTGLTMGSYRFKGLTAGQDYMEVRSWDGTTEGTVPITIALPHHLRPSLASQFGYTYSSQTIVQDLTYNTWTWERSVSNGTYGEVQQIWPPWVLNEVVIAVPAFTGISGQSLLDMSSQHRVWAV